jgi:hypothetical protein
MVEYDSTLFEPAAPIARVDLRNVDTEKTQAGIPMLLDTGADVTLIPQGVLGLLELQADFNRCYELVGFDGSSSLVPIVRLEVVFCGRSFRGQFLLTDQPWGVLGRNVLNMVPLIFDGPNLQWDEYHPPKP